MHRGVQTCRVRWRNGGFARETERPAPAIHADGHVIVLEYFGESVTGKLASLVGIEDFGRPQTVYGLFQSVDTKGRFQRIGNPPG